MRKLLCIILTLCMLCSMTVCASAEEANPDVQPVAEQPAPEQTSGDSGAAGTSSEQPPADAPAAAPDAVVTDDLHLDAAVDAAIAADKDDATVGFAENLDSNVGGVVVESGKEITIDVGNKDVVIEDPTVGSSGTVTIGMQLLKDSEVTIKGERGSDEKNGGSITFDGDSDGKGDGNKMLKRGIQNYSDLTLDGVTIDGTDLSNYNSNQTYDPEYENIVISNCNGSLTVQNGADVLAPEDEVAIAVYAYTSGGYKDGPTVTIEEDAGIIDGAITFDGDEGCENKVETAPSLTIEGGTFTNFLLRIGEAVKGFFEPKQAETETDEAAVAAEAGEDSQTTDTTESTAPITITGGYFSFKDNDIKNAVDDKTGLGLTFENFLAEGYVVVKQNDVYVVMTKEAADAQNKPVVDTIPDNAVIYVPEYVEKPAAKPAAAPAPAPAQTATVVATAPVAIEVNGTTVELSVAEEDIKVEAVAPVATGKAAELKVTLAPAVLAVEGAETADVIEAISASISVEVKGGEEVAAENFEITLDEKGELNVELTAEYLKTLGKGEHTIILKIGGIEIEFVIVIK